MYDIPCGELMRERNWVHGSENGVIFETIS